METKQNRMTKSAAALFLPLAMGLLTGCGEAKIDGSSEAAFQESLTRAVRSLSTEQQQRALAVGAILVQREVEAGNAEPYSVLNGKTGMDLVNKSFEIDNAKLDTAESEEAGAAR